MEYSVLEWIWTKNEIMCYFRDGNVIGRKGTYADVAQLLTELAGQGWEVVTTVASSDFLFWTLRRQAIP